jgi:predicted  nucleic acid-binding Zn-ribbon protein
MWMTSTGTLATLIALGLTSGCGAVKRVHECQGVIEVVNSGLSDLHVQVPDAGASPNAYGQIADAYEALGKRLDELAPSDSSLAKAVASYREVTERAAKHSRSYSEALASLPRSKKERADHEARLTRIRAQAKGDLTKEATVVRKLNAVCHP